jgi:hypothetical protein
MLDTVRRSTQSHESHESPDRTSPATSDEPTDRVVTAADPDGRRSPVTEDRSTGDGCISFRCRSGCRGALPHRAKTLIDRRAGLWHDGDVLGSPPRGSRERQVVARPDRRGVSGSVTLPPRFAGIAASGRSLAPRPAWPIGFGSPPRSEAVAAPFAQAEPQQGGQSRHLLALQAKPWGRFHR